MQYIMRLKSGVDIALISPEDVTAAVHSIQNGMSMSVRSGSWRGAVLAPGVIEYVRPDAESVVIIDGDTGMTKFDAERRKIEAEKTSAYELVPVEIAGTWVLTKGPAKPGKIEGVEGV